MSELVWGIKNGDIEQVKDIIENKVIVTKTSARKAADGLANLSGRAGVGTLILVQGSS